MLHDLLKPISKTFPILSETAMSPSNDKLNIYTFKIK